MSVKSILSTVLLSLQLCLGFWQIGKLTPAGALIQCGIGSFFNLFRLPLGLSTDYARLKGFEGRIWKTVRCHVTAPPDKPTVPRPTRMNDDSSQIKSSYLGVHFDLERKEGNMLLLNGKMAYFITDAIWYSLLDFAEASHHTVFLKGYKEFWQQVATGGVMKLSDVLDSLILENQTVKVLDNDLLLPVNLSVSEEKLLKVVNLVGLFLQTRQVYWLIPTLLSFTAAVMEFSTSLRVWLYEKVNLCFCWGMHVICDLLRRAVRRQIYSFGNWVEGLKPSNDLQLRVVRGDIRAVIGGGAKIDIEEANLVQAENYNIEEATLVKAENYNIEEATLVEGQVYGSISCGKIDADYDVIDIEYWFDENKGKCNLRATTVALAEVDCNRDEFIKLLAFLACIANNRSGSLKSCNSNNKVRVRGFRESVICYSKNGFPTVYELKLKNAVVE